MNLIPDISKGRAIGEILLVLFLFVLLSGFIAIYYQFGFEGFTPAGADYILSEAGIKEFQVPGLLITPLGTVFAILAIYALQRSRGENLQTLGLRKPKSIGWALGWGLGTIVLLFGLLVVIANILQYFELSQSADDFLFIRENIWVFVFALTGITWFHAAFGEELVFRGFILRNLTVLTGGTGVGLAIAVVLQAAIFGALHLNQGVGGGLLIFILALAFGWVFIKVGKNLWPVIIAHGLFDTFQFSNLYFGWLN
ncbi:MAG: CPBP family intramembrane glutamic endopeptidase [Sphingomonadales bacterium]